VSPRKRGLADRPRPMRRQGSKLGAFKLTAQGLAPSGEATGLEISGLHDELSRHLAIDAPSVVPIARVQSVTFMDSTTSPDDRQRYGPVYRRPLGKPTTCLICRR